MYGLLTHSQAHGSLVLPPGHMELGEDWHKLQVGTSTLAKTWKKMAEKTEKKLPKTGKSIVQNRKKSIVQNRKKHCPKQEKG